MHKNIDNVDKKPFMVQNAVVGGLITLKCKDLRIISLKIKHAKEYLNVAASLEALSALSNPELEYPFFYRPMYTILEDGYTIFRYLHIFIQLQFPFFIPSFIRPLTGQN